MDSRVMDTQQDLIIRLTNLYTNLKKEGLDRRTADRRVRYETERKRLWQAIENNHTTLSNANPPADYQNNDAASILNDKFVERLKSWPIAKEEDTVPTTVVKPPTPNPEDLLNFDSDNRSHDDSSSSGQKTNKGADHDNFDRKDLGYDGASDSDQRRNQGANS
ncbi:hypothetical protein ACFFRR_001070 [Megaselia abdita]